MIVSRAHYGVSWFEAICRESVIGVDGALAGAWSAWLGIP